MRIEAVQIAEWMKLKANQEPYYLFVTCLESGARKSEVLGAQWENVNLQLWSIHIPKTKNGKPRDIMIPDDEDFREWLKANRLAKGPIFKLTAWNFRQYWVDALKALGLYDDPDTRLHFHDTRRTALTKLIRQKRSNNFQIAKEMGVSPEASPVTYLTGGGLAMMKGGIDYLKRGLQLSISRDTPWVADMDTPNYTSAFAALDFVLRATSDDVVSDTTPASIANRLRNLFTK